MNNLQKISAVLDASKLSAFDKAYLAHLVSRLSEEDAGYFLELAADPLWLESFCTITKLKYKALRTGDQDLLESVRKAEIKLSEQV